MRQLTDIHLFPCVSQVEAFSECALQLSQTLLRHGRDVWHFAAASQCIGEGAKEVRRELNKAEHDFILKKNQITATKENTKQFWSYMKRLGNGENGVLVNNTIV